MKVYFDNAATTPLDPEVIKVMLPVMQKQFGNPSSIHAYGREVRSIIENARKSVARLLNTSPGEIFFTSGGTEANNMAIRCSIHDLGLKHAVTTHIEHHAVEQTLETLKNEGLIELTYLNVDKKGNISLDELENILKSKPRSLVSIMHANNELGTMNPIDQIGEICRRYDAIFHSDTVQTMGHFKHDLKALPVDFITCAAHKFHGPKGAGFLYVNNRIKIKPFITGGAQERNMRGGTENVYGIAGLAKALEIAYGQMESHSAYISDLRLYMIKKLTDEIPGISFNSETDKESLYTVLNISFPSCDFAEMLLFNLDISGIAVSGGSACSSGSNSGSHVLKGIGADPERPSVRFSFSKFNTKDEINFVVEKLKEMFLVKA